MSLYGGVELPGRPDLENVRKLDLLSIKPISRMMRYGFAISIPHFLQLSSDLSTLIAEKHRTIISLIPPDKLSAFLAASGVDDDEVDEDEFNIDSTQQMAQMLFDVLGIGKSSKLKTTKSGKVAVDKKQLENLKSEHPIIQEVLDYRGLVKLKGTYVDKLPRIARFHPRGDCPVCGLTHRWETNRVHTELLLTRTTTNRVASKNPNLQNISARTELGRRVREGFIASPGTMLCQRDFSQIELRILAHCSGDENMIRIYKQNIDIHLDTACRAFDLLPEQIDKLLHRAPCKNVNFGICYGLSEVGLYDQMLLTYATALKPVPKWLTQEWCKQFIAQWFSLYPKVKPFMDHEQYCALRYGIVWTLFGFARRIPEVRSVHKRIQQAGIRQAGNVKIQGTATGGLTKLACAAIDDRLEHIRDAGYWAWPILPIHDEIIVEAEEKVADAVQEMMADEMDGVMDDRQTGRCLSRVPIQSEGHTIDKWKKD